MGGQKRRRGSDTHQAQANFGMGQTLSLLRDSETPSANRDVEQSRASENNSQEGEWETVDRRSKRQKKLEKNNNYPSITHAPTARLQSAIKISDLQTLTLYLLADGGAPQWVSVRHHNSVGQVVVLMVPGLEADMFTGKIALTEIPKETTSKEASKDGQTTTNIGTEPHEKLHISPDDYYPVKLISEKLANPLKPLAEMFPHIWPVKTPGDDKYSRIHSPLHAMLTSPLPKSKEEKKAKGPLAPREGKNWQNKRTPITEYLATVEELQENEYVIHPAMFTSSAERENELEKRRIGRQFTEDGWVDTKIAKLEDGDVPEKEIEKGSLTAGRHIVAIDCEMCKTEGDNFELTRISLAAWDGSVILDELVKPDRPIVDYLTPYSGITEAMLAPITTRLADIQKRLVEIITPRTILIGHSLNADLTALKMTHPFVVDTTILYPHPRGPPLKSSLKWLAQKYLSREIQKNHGSTGHDSIEDARTCLDLVKQKCERGPKWGTSEASGESIFKRLGRSQRTNSSKADAAQQHRTGAVVDWGDPRRGHGAHADVCIGCENDAEVVDGVKNAVHGYVDKDEVSHPAVDFVWGRLRELEALRGWWNRAKTSDVEELRANALAHANPGESSESPEATQPSLADAVARTVAHIAKIYESLPPRTAFIVYSGTGDPRETARLQAMQQQFKKEYATKKWDQLSVKWTDTEDQALRRACRKAREGVGFVVVK